MVVKYDILDRLEKPQLTLCNPGCTYTRVIDGDVVNGIFSNMVCPIIDHEAEEAVFNFNATSELNFRVNKPKHDTEESAFYDAIFLSRNRTTETVYGDSVEVGFIPQALGLSAGEKYWIEITRLDGTKYQVESYQTMYGPDFSSDFPEDSIILGVPSENYSLGGWVFDKCILTDSTEPGWIKEVSYGNGSGYMFNEDEQDIKSFKVFGIKQKNDEDFATYIYDSIQNRRLVFFDNIGFFSINNVDETYGDSGYYKDVKAQSIDVELQQRMIPYIADGTYILNSDNDENRGILQRIIETIPLWQIGHVDDTVSSKYRTFEDVSVDTNCLSFLMNEVQDAYECIIIFDIINRLVNVYDQATYVHDTNIFLTKDDLVNTINISENADDLYTAISVTGGDNITISGINPTGVNTIYDFSYYSGWMTQGLGRNIIDWQNAVDDARDSYYNYNLLYYQYKDDAYECDAEIDRLNGLISLYEKCRTNVIAECGGSSVITARGTIRIEEYNKYIRDKGGSTVSADTIQELLDQINDDISTYLSALDEKYSILESINENITNVKSAIDDISNSLKLENYLSEDELTELNNYIFQGKYNDEYIVFTDTMTNEQKFDQMKILYDRAVLQLNKISKPTQEFSVDVENFIFAKRFQHFSENIETGCLINVELKNNDMAKLFLTSMSINYDDKDFKLTFGNRFNKFDTKSLFENVLGSVSKSANTLNYVKDIIYPIKQGELDYMNEAIKSSRNLTMYDALASTAEETLIDATGYTGKRIISDTGEYDPHQIKIISSNIVFTNDGWNTSKLAIGEINIGNGETIYGINGEAIIGEMIIGNTLQIYSYTGNNHYVFVKTQDTEIDPNKTYYILVNNDYIEVLNPVQEELDIYYEKETEFVKTQDTEIDPNKTYYQFISGEYIEVDNPVVADLDTYYEKIYVVSPETKTVFEIMDDKISSAVSSSELKMSTEISQTADAISIKVNKMDDDRYKGTEDTDIIQGKTYYTRSYNNDGLREYTIVSNPQQSELYIFVKTVDTEIAPGKTYYELDGGNYVIVQSPVPEDLYKYYEKESNYFELVQDNSLTTSTGYTFGSDGLNISNSESDLSTTITNNGLEVTRNDTEHTSVLKADAEGVNALNLTARKYLIIEQHCRFEEYGTNNDRTACFYI